MTIKLSDLLLLSIGISMLTACSVRKDDYSDSLFSVERTYDFNYRSLLKEGFERVSEVDILVLEKLNADTTITMSFEEDGKILYSKNWRFLIPSSEKEWIDSFFQSNGAFLMSPVGKYDLSDDLFFTVKEVKQNRLFLCNVLFEAGNLYLDVVYYYPR